MNVKIFVVFHKGIDERLIFASFSPAEVEAYFALYAVSDRFPEKRVTYLDGRSEIAGAQSSRVVFESRLDWYDPALQAQGFLETSSYVHLLRNRLHEPFDYIGITQYDMRWSRDAAGLMRRLSHAREGVKGIAFGMNCGLLMDELGRFHPSAFAQSRNWAFLMESYNRFFGRDWTLGILKNKPFTLYQTYILPKAEFAALAGWLETLCREVYPWANQSPYETHWGALSGYTERAEALFIAARLHERALSLVHLPLEHDGSIPLRLGIAKEHYKAG